MSAPDWWSTSRYGLFVHSNLASVPAWAPIGQYSDWYRSHLGDPVPDVIVHPSPLVEVVAHHRDRWSHVTDYYDFLDLLTFENFDADEWADLAVEAGMAYTVFVSKHHDGVCFWDAPGGSRSVTGAGPRRNVLAEYAAACERAGIAFGTYYSLLDWGHEAYPGATYVNEVLHPQVVDLVERYGSRILWGDGHWGHGPDHWQTEALIERIRAIDPEIVVNDRWWARHPDITTFEYQIPDDVPESDWELCRGIGHSFCHNRVEQAEHHLDAAGIVGLLTEVVAKGGNLLLNVGPAADGTVPDLQAAPLRAAGEWVRAHREIIEVARPWRGPDGRVYWGADGVRIMSTGDDSAPVAIDLTGEGRFAMFGPEIGTITAVSALDGSPVEFEHDRGGLRIHRLDRGRHGLGTAYRLSIEPRRELSIGLFEPADSPPIPLAPLLADAVPGTVIRLGEGRYIGPATIGRQVTVRGLGSDRTVIDGEGAAGPVVTLAEGARLEHVTVTGTAPRVAWGATTAVAITGPGALILGSHLDGHAVVLGADGARIRGCTLAGVVAHDAAEVLVSRSQLRGMRWDTGIEITGGHGHHIEGCDLSDHLCALRLSATIDTVVRGNTISARWWGVHLRESEAAHIVANRIRATMRAVDVEGGSDVLVDANAVADGDSGCLIERGAAAVTVSGNHWSRCRIGVLAWESPDVTVRDNTVVDLLDAVMVTGP